MKRNAGFIALGLMLIIAFGAGALAFSSQPMMMQGATSSPPAGIMACDYGPNTTLPTGALGTDLTTAGFTHCVLNADFTDNSGAHVASGGGTTNWVMNNPNTYMGNCNGASLSSFGSLWLALMAGGGTPFDKGNAACGKATIVNDGTGTNVLTWSFGPSDINVPSGAEGLAIMWPKCSSTCGGGPALPLALYEEVTWRITAGNSNPGTIFAGDEQTNIYGSDPTQCVPPTTGGCQLDMVWGEYVSLNRTTAISMDNYVLNNKFSEGWTFTPDITNYHTVANLSTTDGSTTFNSCMYLDGVGYPGLTSISFDPMINPYCAHWSHYSDVGYVQISNHDRRLWRFIGDYTNSPPMTGDLTSPVTIQLKSIRIFACGPYLGNGNDCTASEAGGSLVYH